MKNSIQPESHSDALEKSILDFVSLRGKDLQDRSASFHRWLQARREEGVWPYNRELQTKASCRVRIADDWKREAKDCINFASQDYLGLTSEPEIEEAAKRGIDEWGVHSAGSPTLSGRTRALGDLERRVADILRHEACTVYSTGWAAGFGVIAGLVRKRDLIFIDALAHNCLQVASEYATPRVKRMRHNDLMHLAELLKRERHTNPDGGIFLVLESLYSMDSDSPDLERFLKLASEYEAIVILDIAHDFGAMGEGGLGLLDDLPGKFWPDVIIGSFSKTFAANGGFVAASKPVQDYLQVHSPSMAFSNAISPVQVAVVSACLDIVFSEKGAALRKELMRKIHLLREAMERHDFHVQGTPSPIVPVFVGDEKLARLTSKFIERNGLSANLVEYPAVAKGKARFRFQLMRTHEPEDIETAAAILQRSRTEALQISNNQ